MRNKQRVATNTQQPPPEIRPAAEMSHKAGVESIHGEIHEGNERIPSSGNPQTDEDAHLLSAEEVDLAFERDEMLQPEAALNHMISGPKVWQVKGLDLKLSALEATVTVKSGIFTYDDFEM